VAAAITARNWVSPASPIPVILPPSSDDGDTRDSSTSTTRLDFSSTTPVSTKLP
jgi:hypothetical protein